jgi:dipeptidase
MCDTLIALPPATRDGAALFAKNSDRPARECQRIVQFPRRRHPRGARVRCQYIEIPQVEQTAAVLGSQPYWLWGFEHGVNEHRVAIGNETVFAREPLGDTGLLGMDLVRLGLERGRTATEALEVMTALLEAHGQGGSGHRHLHWPYHNGFLIADPRSAWILETSGRHWVARPVDGVGNISNGLVIGTDWTRGSPDVTSFAVAQGWWPATAGRVDFAAAYADESGVPPHQCVPRRQRAAALLAEGFGRHEPATFRAILRDHYDAGVVHRPRPFDDPCFFSLCMHADPLDNTTAAMIARLPTDPAALAVAWVCLGSPCTGAFLPLYPLGRVPARLALGGGEPDAASPWWRMRALLELVERDFARFGPVVRARWDAFEAALAREAAAEEAHAAAEPAAAPTRLTAFMERTVDAWLACADALCRELGDYS